MGSLAMVHPSSGTALLHMTLVNVADAVESARQAVLACLDGRVSNPQVVYRVELVLEEVLMNIVRHAFAGTGGQPIDLQLTLTANEVVMQFEDDGIAFDPLSAEAPTWPPSVAQAQPGGLGLSLVRRFAHSLRYERLEGRNRLTVGVARG